MTRDMTESEIRNVPRHRVNDDVRHHTRIGRTIEPTTRELIRRLPPRRPSPRYTAGDHEVPDASLTAWDEAVDHAR